ncbi:MAG: UbiA family prenyltransferase [candidate division KSB1 bacterium]|nr:UbiA family prenyltransferase [candidate division KSB1 bacterium]
MNRLPDYFFLTRPILFFPGWATLLAGFAAAFWPKQLIPFYPPPAFSPLYWHPRPALAMLSFAAAMGGCFILNQLQDVHSDRENNKLFLIGEGVVSLQAAQIEAGLLLLLALLTAARLGKEFLFCTAIFILITGALYNYRPFSLKNRPLGGLTANILMGWLAFALGRLLIMHFDIELFVASLPYVFFNTALYFLTTLPDYDGDLAANKITFPVRYGKSFTILTSPACWAIGLALAVYLQNYTMTTVSAVTGIFMVRLLFKRTVEVAVVTLKAGIAALALTMCFFFPAFLLLLIVLFFSTRFYYRKRFNFDYPNFRGR